MLTNKEFIIEKKDFENKKEVFEYIASNLIKNNITVDVQNVITKLQNRENEASTGFENGIAIPHAKIDGISQPIITILRTNNIEWQSMDNNPANLIINILVPNDAGNEHLKILSQLTRKLLDTEFTTFLKTGSIEEVVNTINTIEVKTQEETKSSNKKSFVAITSCPMGVAHTYMAAEALELYAKNNGYDCMVETQGTVGVENKLTSEAISEADFVIIAADRTVELDRFVGKKLLECTTKQAINKTDEVFKASHNSTTYEGSGSSNGSSELKGQNEIMKALMNGVSHMLPLVVVGGLFLGLALMFGGEATSEGMVIPEGTFWYTIQNVGLVGFTLMIPVLAGYIAYSIGDRSALAPGLIIGWIANNGSFYNSEASSGFLGAIIGGIMVGYFVKYFSKIRIHKNLQSLMPILIIPLVSTFVTSVAFIYILGKPIAIMFTVLSDFLASMPQEQMILMGALLGFMIAIDMGGPINKTAMLFAIGMIPTAPVFMGINGVAVAVPSIGIGLATIIGRKYFNEEERSAGIASIGMGFAGITEGAIPFAAAHPKQVFPANLIGSMVGGMIAAFFMVENVVPHGGILIAFTGGVNEPLIFIMAILIGSLVTALIAVAGMRYKYLKVQRV